MTMKRFGLLAGIGAMLCVVGPASAQRGAPLPWQQDPFPSRYRTPPAEDMLLRGATILDGAGGRIDGGDVLVRGGKIVTVGQHLANPGVREVDAKGRWVTPGVIDVHTHNGTFVLPLTAIDREASDVSEVATPNSADTWIETAVNTQDMGFDRALSNGVTTLQILPGSTPIFAGRSVVVKPVGGATVWDMKATGGVQGFKIACGENPKSWGADDDNEGPTSRQGVISFMRQEFVEAQHAETALPYVMTDSTKLPSRDTGGHHVKFEPGGARLFMARLKDGLTVCDVDRGQTVATVENSIGANGPVLLPKYNRGYVAMDDPAADGKGHLYAPARLDGLVLKLGSGTLKERARWDVGCSVSKMKYLVATDRLLGACGGDRPAVFLMDPANGRVLSRVPIGKGLDALAYDEGRERIVSSNCEGSMTVIRRDGRDSLRVIATIRTAYAARMLDMNHRTGRLYLVNADSTDFPEKDGGEEETRHHPGSFRVETWQPN